MKSAYHKTKAACFNFLLMTLALSLYECARQEKTAVPKPAVAVSPTKFVAPYDSSRAVVHTFKKDLGVRGSTFYVVTSKDTTIQTEAGYSIPFDRVEIFRFDSLKWKFESLLVDVFEYGRETEFRDLTNDGKEEIIVHRDAGGNDPVASCGLYVYGWTSDTTLDILFYNDDGNPRVQDIDGDHTQEIVVSGEFRGVMPHALVIPYTLGIHTFDGEKFTQNNLTYIVYFMKRIARAKKLYEKKKKKLIRQLNADDYPLYREFAEWIIWVSASGNVQLAKTIWAREHAFLENRLPEEQFDDLDSFIIELDSVDGKENPIDRHDT